MPKVVKSTIIDAPVDRVWEALRDFNGHDRWHPAVATSTIERGQPSDKVGCVRRFKLKDGAERASSCSRSPTSNRPSAIACSIRRCRCSTTWRTCGCFRSPTATAHSGAGSRFDTRAGEDAQMVGMVGEQIYQAGFDAIRQHLAA